MIRPAKIEDALGILTAHHSAVHTTAAKDYPIETLEVWSSSVTPERVARYLQNSLPNETTVVAEVEGEISGFGAIVETLNQLRAVYVSAEFAGLGVGSKILARLEQMAIKRGCAELSMHSSVTAAEFYHRHGYEELERSSHSLRPDIKMASVKMRKSLV